MVTEEQILAAEGYDLEDLAGQVLKPDEYEWDKKGVSHKIALTWDNAMKWRDWAVKEFGADGFAMTLKGAVSGKWMQSVGLSVLDHYAISSAKPEHYLQAAAIAKLNAEKGTK